MYSSTIPSAKVFATFPVKYIAGVADTFALVQYKAPASQHSNGHYGLFISGNSVLTW